MNGIGNKDGLTVDVQQARAKSRLSDCGVIMSRITWPATGKCEWSRSGIRNAVSCGARNVVQTPRLHRLKPGPSVFIHQNECSLAAYGGVEFSTITHRMKVAMRHKKLVANLAGFHHSSAPEQAAGGSFGYWQPVFNPVNHRLGVHSGRNLRMKEKGIQLRDLFNRTRHRFSGKCPGAPVDLYR